MCTVIVIITTVQFVTLQLPTRLSCWRNSALALRFITHSMCLYIFEPVIIFTPTRLFWTKSKKRIHSSQVPHPNLGILIMNLSEVPSPGVLWHILTISSKVSSSSFSRRAKGIIGLNNSFGWLFAFWGIQSSIFDLVISQICGEGTFLCRMMKIVRRETCLFNHSLRWLSLWVCWGSALVACSESVFSCIVTGYRNWF